MLRHMSDQGDSEPATHLRLDLSVRAREVTGTVRDDGGNTEAFDGWLGLLGAIEAARLRLAHPLSPNPEEER